METSEESFASHFFLRVFFAKHFLLFLQKKPEGSDGKKPCFFLFVSFFASGEQKKIQNIRSLHFFAKQKKSKAMKRNFGFFAFIKSKTLTKVTYL